MEPIEFPQQNGKLAKSQPQFRPLPVCIRPMTEDPKDGAQFTVKYQLSEIEFAQFSLTKCFYFSQFGHGFQPILPQVESPFGVVVIKYDKIKNYEFKAWVPLDQGGEHLVEAISARQLIDRILEAFPNLEAENLFFVERPKMAISANGLIDL
jgi:hypothetical protein